MDFGSTQCKPANPKCNTCVIVKYCKSYEFQNIKSRPRKIKKQKKIKIRHLNYLFIYDKNYIYLQKRRNFDISTLCESSNKDIGNPNIVKVVLSNYGEALYFSRAPIPHSEHTEDYLRHIGLYAYRVDILNKLTAFPVTHYENLERLEQLRALAFGIRIYVAVSDFSIPPGIDTPEDLEAVVSLLT